MSVLRWFRRRTRDLRGRLNGPVPTRPVFVVGCQRSGTTICENVFLRSPDCAVFKEANRSAMTADWRLRDADQIRGLVEDCQYPVALFKPISDAHRADELLDEFEGARVIWIYRRWADTARSAVVKWQDAQLRIIEQVADPSADSGATAYAERVDEAVRQRLEAWVSEGLDALSGAAALWWLRNQFVLSLSLDRDPRVLLVRYEDLATDPARVVQRMCDHMEIPYSPRLVEPVHARSVGHGDTQSVHPAVQAACDLLQERLDRAFDAAAEHGTADGQQVNAGSRP